MANEKTRVFIATKPFADNNGKALGRDQSRFQGVEVTDVPITGENGFFVESSRMKSFSGKKFGDLVSDKTNEDLKFIARRIDDEWNEIEKRINKGGVYSDIGRKKNYSYYNNRNNSSNQQDQKSEDIGSFRSAADVGGGTVVVTGKTGPKKSIIIIPGEAVKEYDDASGNKSKDLYKALADHYNKGSRSGDGDSYSRRDDTERKIVYSVKKVESSNKNVSYVEIRAMKFDMSELTRDVFAKRNLVSDLKKMIEADRQEEQDPEKKEEIRRPADEYIVKIDVSRFRIMDERASEFEKFKSMDHNADNSSSYVEYYNSDPARNLRFGNTYVYMDVFVVEKVRMSVKFLKELYQIGDSKDDDIHGYCFSNEMLDILYGIIEDEIRFDLGMKDERDENGNVDPNKESVQTLVEKIVVAEREILKNGFSIVGSLMVAGTWDLLKNDVHDKADVESMLSRSMSIDDPSFSSEILKKIERMLSDGELVDEMIKGVSAFSEFRKNGGKKLLDDFEKEMNDHNRSVNYQDEIDDIEGRIASVSNDIEKLEKQGSSNGDADLDKDIADEISKLNAKDRQKLAKEMAELIRRRDELKEASEGTSDDGPYESGHLYSPEENAKSLSEFGKELGRISSRLHFSENLSGYEGRYGKAKENLFRSGDRDLVDDIYGCLNGIAGQVMERMNKIVSDGKDIGTNEKKQRIGTYFKNLGNFLSNELGKSTASLIGKSIIDDLVFEIVENSSGSNAGIEIEIDESTGRVSRLEFNERFRDDIGTSFKREIDGFVPKWKTTNVDIDKADNAARSAVMMSEDFTEKAIGYLEGYMDKALSIVSSKSKRAVNVFLKMDIQSDSGDDSDLEILNKARMDLKGGTQHGHTDS